MRGRLRIGIGLFLAAVVGSTGVAAAVAYGGDAPAPLSVTAPGFRLHDGGGSADTAIVPIHHFFAGQAVVPAVAVYADPDPAAGAVPWTTMSNPTHEGFPLEVAVLDRSADHAWLYVRLPMRPNGAGGWVRASDFAVSAVPNRIEVTLSTHTLAVYDGDSDHVLFRTDVATGRPNTPTPTGDFYIDIVNPLGHDRVYGWGQLSVAGFSDALQHFDGGIGQIAIHGWNNDSVMGTSASNGCVRMRNVDIEQVAALAPAGTPVAIVP